VYTEDFILRMIRQAVAVLVQVIGLKKAGQYQEAEQAIDGALERLLGLRAGLLKQLDDGQILEMLTVQEKLDVERLAVIADLFSEEGEILSSLNRPEEAAFAFERALRFYLETALQEVVEPRPDLLPKIDRLYRRLSHRDLPLETRLALLDYYEGLLGKEESVLTASGFSRERVMQLVAGLREQLKPYLS